MKKHYEKPVIEKLQSGLMNKFGPSPAYARRVRSEIDGVSVAKLVERFGSPLFVFSEQRLRARYRQIRNAYATRYPKVVFGWSYKTNYLGSICRALHQEGAIAEVVCEMEYDKARALGVPGEQIIFNGPHKPLHVLEKAIAANSTINVDSMDEILDLEKIAGQLGRELRVGIRLNLDAGIYPQWSRFGFNLESGQAMDAAKRMASGGKLRIRGLHCHIGTFILDPKAYARQIDKMVRFGYELETHFKWPMEYIDIGGGLPSRNRLKGSYLSPDVGVPSIDEFAEHACDALSRALRPGDFPTLILESGRAIVDEAAWLISTVSAVKRLPDGTRAYVLDAGVNILFTTNWYKLGIELESEVPGMNEFCVLYGPLCMNIDVVDEGVQLPPLPRGTRLLFSPVGAYNTTQWMQFIQYRPAIVLVGTKGEVDVIRRAEELADLTHCENIPARLVRDAEPARGAGTAPAPAPEPGK